MQESGAGPPARGPHPVSGRVGAAVPAEPQLQAPRRHHRQAGARVGAEPRVGVGGHLVVEDGLQVQGRAEGERLQVRETQVRAAGAVVAPGGAEPAPRAAQVRQPEIDLPAHPGLAGRVAPAQAEHRGHPVRAGPRHQGPVHAHRVRAGGVDDRLADLFPQVAHQQPLPGALQIGLAIGDPEPQAAGPPQERRRPRRGQVAGQRAQDGAPSREQRGLDVHRGAGRPHRDRAGHPAREREAGLARARQDPGDRLLPGRGPEARPGRRQVLRQQRRPAREVRPLHPHLADPVGRPRRHQQPRRGRLAAVVDRHPARQVAALEPAVAQARGQPTGPGCRVRQGRPAGRPELPQPRPRRRRVVRPLQALLRSRQPLDPRLVLPQETFHLARGRRARRQRQPERRRRRRRRQRRWRHRRCRRRRGHGCGRRWRGHVRPCRRCRRRRQRRPRETRQAGEQQRQAPGERALRTAPSTRS